MTYHPYPQISKMADNLILYQNMSHVCIMFWMHVCIMWHVCIMCCMYNVLESLSNETIKIFVVISFQRITALYV